MCKQWFAFICCVQERVCVVSVYGVCVWCLHVRVCAVCVHACAVIREGHLCVLLYYSPSYFIETRSPLSLELSWQPTVLSDPLVPFFRSAGVIGTCVDIPGFLCYTEDLNLGLYVSTESVIAH